MVEEKKETVDVDGDVTPPTTVQEAEIAASESKKEEAKKEEPVKEQDSEKELEPVKEESSENKEEGVSGPSAEEIDIIEQEIAKLKQGDDKTAEQIQEQINKIKELTDSLSKQQAEIAKEKEELSQSRKGYATIPAVGNDESSSAPDVELDPQEKYNQLSNEEAYAEFEKLYLKK